MELDIDGVGRRVAYWRTRRGLSQERFGALLGRSRSWVDKLERGGRQTDPRISVLEKVSAVLAIPLETLLAGETKHRNQAECVDEVEIDAIRAAIHRYDVSTGAFSTPTDEDPTSTALVKRQAAYGWDAFQGAHYSALGRLLPSLIIDAQRAAGAADDSTGWAATSQTWQLASAVLVKFADAPAAWCAADRAVAAAERSGNPIVIASAGRRLAHALTTLGQHVAALEMCLAAVTRLEQELLTAGEDGLSVLGMLYLKAAVCAADLGDSNGVEQFIAEARRPADMLGRDTNAQWTGFGPTNTAIHEVSTRVQLRDGTRAVRAAATIDPAALASLPRERRTQHLVDLAQAYVYGGQPERALETLLEAESLGAQEVRCRQATRTTIVDLTHQMRTPNPRLRALAQRCGVAA